MLLPNEVFRASRLDEFRRYQSGELFNGDEYTREAFVSYLTERHESPAMAAGSAVHRSLELAMDGSIASDEQLGWRISYEIDASLDLPTMREVPMRRTHNGVTLFGRVDSITATTVRDIKTTAQVDADRYADSYQWRAYLWMSGRTRFVYDVLKVKVDEAAKSVTVTDYVKLIFHRYANLDRDVECLLDEYAATVSALGLFSSEAA